VLPPSSGQSMDFTVTAIKTTNALAYTSSGRYKHTWSVPFSRACVEKWNWWAYKFGLDFVANRILLFGFFFAHFFLVSYIIMTTLFTKHESAWSTRIIWHNNVCEVPKARKQLRKLLWVAAAGSETDVSNQSRFHNDGDSLDWKAGHLIYRYVCGLTFT
jgi:hypothetical protein